MLKKLWKDKNGSGIVMNITVIMITIAVILILIKLLMYSSERSTLKNDVDIIMRRYLLVMETEGYLSESKQKELSEELKKLGMYNISLTGTTITRAEYGGYIELSVSAYIDMDSENILSVFTSERKTETYHIKRYLKSTSQY